MNQRDDRLHLLELARRPSPYKLQVVFNPLAGPIVTEQSGRTRRRYSRIRRWRIVPLLSTLPTNLCWKTGNWPLPSCPIESDLFVKRLAGDESAAVSGAAPASGRAPRGCLVAARQHVLRRDVIRRYRPG